MEKRDRKTHFQPPEAALPSGGRSGSMSDRSSFATPTQTPRNRPINRLRCPPSSQSEISVLTTNSNSVASPPSHNAVAVTQTTQEYGYPEFSKDLLEDEEDGGGDSDDNGHAAKEFLFDEDEDEIEIQHQRNLSRPHPKDPVYLLKNGVFEKALNFPKIPENWKRPEPKLDKGEPPFEDVDNPGGWNDYIYYPKFDKDGKYMYHRLPSGVTPVPGAGTSSIRDYMGWKFHYVAWNGDSSSSPSTTSVDESSTTNDEDSVFSRKFVEPTAKRLFPPERRGSLDQDKLLKYGLTQERMANGDALFFYQLLLPLHLSEFVKSFEDNRMNYYNRVLDWTTTYHNKAYRYGYGRRPNTISFEELLKFDGILYLHGALGAKHSIKKRWDKNDCFYQKDIARSQVSWGRWCEIRRNLKLCDNAVEEVKRQIDPKNFNPAYKFDHIYECLIHNVREFTKKACPDIVIDESTWPYYGFGPYVDYLVDKMVSRGGQTVLLMDADRVRPRGFLHRSKSYQKNERFPTRGMSEVYDLMIKYVLPLIGAENGKLWSFGPHLTVDNYFNGDEILDWMGENGLGMIGTVARNRLPRGVCEESDKNGKKRKAIESKFFHKESTSGNPRAKLARFAPPITMVREVPASIRYSVGTKVEKKFADRGVLQGEVISYNHSLKLYKVQYTDNKGEDMSEKEVTQHLLPTTNGSPSSCTKSAYRRVHCSFQSTGACNIGSVNSIPCSNLFVSPKQRGKGKDKRQWGIEMNQSRELYLGSYGRIDQADAAISRTDIKYVCWKYYHAAVNHAKSLVIATAYDMYKECTEGVLNQAWKVEKPLTFNEFQQRLGKQLIRYKSKHLHLPGDEGLRAARQAHIKYRGLGLPMTPAAPTRKNKRNRMRERCVKWTSEDGIEHEYLSIGSIKRAELAGRFCSGLPDFERHLCSKKKATVRNCFMCGHRTTTRCTCCFDNLNRSVPLCSMNCPTNPGKMCFLRWHDQDYFGLGYKDKTDVRGEKKEDWCSPTDNDLFNNRLYVKYVQSLTPQPGDYWSPSSEEEDAETAEDDV